MFNIKINCTYYTTMFNFRGNEMFSQGEKRNYCVYVYIDKVGTLYKGPSTLTKQ